MGGCPRSGTTLLQVMLDMHPELGMPRETNFIRELWWRRRHFGDLRDPANRRRVARVDLLRQGAPLPPPDPQADLARGGDRGRWSRPGRERSARSWSAASACTRSGKPRWGDKRPAYSGFVRPLLAMFPDAQYVNVVRDPRGIVASQCGNGLGPAGPRGAGRGHPLGVRRRAHGLGRARPAARPAPRRALRGPLSRTRTPRWSGSWRGRDFPPPVDFVEGGWWGEERPGWFVGPHELAGGPVTTDVGGALARRA